MTACCALAGANPAEHWICLELLAPPFGETKGGKQPKEMNDQTESHPIEKWNSAQLM